jgi:hypothetical protein
MPGAPKAEISHRICCGYGPDAVTGQTLSSHQTMALLAKRWLFYSPQHFESDRAVKYIIKTLTNCIDLVI